MAYDCTADVNEHRGLVEGVLHQIGDEPDMRAYAHDLSKLKEPEKTCYDTWKPVLEKLTFGTPEYLEALGRMGEGLQAHFRNNRHHPEFFPNGVEGMTLVDLVEMFADWMAVSKRKGQPLAMDALAERFHIGPQLRAILENTEKALK